jgi:hypothetical protein
MSAHSVPQSPLAIALAEYNLGTPERDELNFSIMPYFNLAIPIGSDIWETSGKLD